MTPTNAKRAEMKLAGYTWVKAHTRNDHAVRGHWRRVSRWTNEIMQSIERQIANINSAEEGIEKGRRVRDFNSYIEIVAGRMNLDTSWIQKTTNRIAV